MNIDFLITSLGGGGAERVLCNLANYLANRGVNVSITAIRGDSCKYNIDNNISVSYLQKDYYERKISLVDRGVEIKRVLEYFIRLNKNHCLVCFLELPVAYSLIFRSFIKSKLVICERNNPVFYSSVYQKIFRMFAKRADFCICQTKVIANWYAEVFEKSSKIGIIPNSINKAILQADKGNRTSKEIVTFARLTPQKNQRLLIEAFSTVSKRFPEYQLIIYGQGPLREELTKLINDLDLEDKVLMPGFNSDPIKVLSKASLFVLTSDHEGMPNALAEAMAMGVPCISTDCGGGGARELIDNGKNGILVPCRDKESLVKAMLQLLGDTKFADQISCEAFKIREQLEPDFIHAQWHYYLQEVMK